MYVTEKSGFETQAQRRRLGVLLFALAVVLAVPTRSYCYSIYSGTSVGSDGTVYGWAVTDGTPPPGYSMTHTAYGWTSLTSPSGRYVASGPSGTYAQGVNTVRVQVSLPFVPTDLGIFKTISMHGVW
jgi:hypothetical protein